MIRLSSPSQCVKLPDELRYWCISLFQMYFGSFSGNTHPANWTVFFFKDMERIRPFWFKLESKKHILLTEILTKLYF